MRMSLANRHIPPRVVVGWLLGVILSVIVGKHVTLSPTADPFTNAVPSFLFAVVILASLYSHSRQSIAIWTARVALALASVRISCGPDHIPQIDEAAGLSAVFFVLFELLELARDLIEPSGPRRGGGGLGFWKRWTLRDWIRQSQGIWERTHVLRTFETPIADWIEIQLGLTPARSLKKVASEIESILTSEEYGGYMYFGRISPTLKALLADQHLFRPYGSGGRIDSAYRPELRHIQRQLLARVRFPVKRAVSA